MAVSPFGVALDSPRSLVGRPCGPSVRPVGAGWQNRLLGGEMELLKRIETLQALVRETQIRRSVCWTGPTNVCGLPRRRWKGLTAC